MYRQNRIVKSPLLIIIKEAEARMFVHLKTKTIYSLLEGAIFAKALADRCSEFKMPAVGIADRANLFGVIIIVLSYYIFLPLSRSDFLIVGS